MKRDLTVWLIVMVILMLSTVSSAQELHLGQQLLAFDWNNYKASSELQVVGYALYFIEIEQAVAQSLSLNWEWEKDQLDSGTWVIRAEQDSLSVSLDTPLHFRSQLEHEFRHNKQMTTQESWLLTMEGKPLQIRVSQSSVPTSQDVLNGENLEITILPKRINGEQEIIESEITLRFETRAGGVSSLQTTAWVGADAQQPLAIISRQVQVGKNVDYKHFALYLVGAPIPEELLPKEMPFLAVGSIEGVQHLLSDGIKAPQAELGLGFTFHQDQWGWVLHSTLPLAANYRAYGELHSIPELTYFLGIEGAINGELSFLCELDKGGLSWGVRDQLQFGECIEIAVAALPLHFRLTEPKVDLALRWRVQATYHLKTAGVRLAYAWDRQHGGKVSLGMQMRF